jgi:hypothetical protein
MLNKKFLGTSALILGLLMPTTLNNLAARASEQNYFTSSPHLIRSATSHNSASTPSTYQFTIHIPDDAKASLKAISIVQQPNTEKIAFDLQSTRAFLGDSFAGGNSVGIESLGGDEDPNSNDLTVVFQEPVKPGDTVTISLRAKHNPLFGGVYQFGITAYPEGNDDRGLYLGSGRLDFFNN